MSVALLLGLLLVQTSDAALVLSWTYTPYSAATPGQGFVIRRCLQTAGSCTMAEVARVGIDVRTWRDTQTQPDSVYQYEMVTYDDATGVSSPVTPRVTKGDYPLNAVTNLVATPKPGATPLTMTLSWSYTPKPQRPGTQFQVQRCEQSPSGCVLADYTKIGIGERTWDNTVGLVAGATYCYALIPFDAEPQRPSSPQTCATMPGLAAPLNLTVTIGP